MNPLINVLQSDIDDACRNDLGHCMVAKALRRHFKTDLVAAYTAASNGKIPVFWVKKNRFHASPAVQVKMVDFDSGIPVKPFKFRLREGVPSGDNYKGNRFNGPV